MPHPKGKVAVSYVNTKGKWDVVINLPETISGDFFGMENITHLKVD